MQKKIILKNLLVLFILIVLFLVTYTGFLFLFGKAGSVVLYLHNITGVVLLVFSFYHLYEKRDKIKKLFGRLIRIITNKNSDFNGDMDFIVKSFENKTLKELCTIFNIKYEELNAIFRKNGINNSSEKLMLKEISESKTPLVFPLIAKVLESKVKK